MSRSRDGLAGVKAFKDKASQARSGARLATTTQCSKKIL
jgi:hypothetical protein